MIAASKRAAASPTTRAAAPSPAEVATLKYGALAITMQRRGHVIAGLLLAAVLSAATLAAAEPTGRAPINQSSAADEINAILSPDEPARQPGQVELGPDATKPQAKPNVSGADDGDAAAAGDDAMAAADKELWLPAVEPLKSIHLIAARPERGGTCREVIFKRQPVIPHRLSATAGKRIQIPLDKVCWIGLRNGSGSRTVVLRLGEAIERLALMPVPQFLVGRDLKPHEQVRIHLRPIRGEPVEVSLEAIWMDALTAGERAEKMTLKFIAPTDTRRPE